MKKVLQLSTYPITNPLHGGQIRVHEIRQFLEDHGCLVKSISLSEDSHKFYSDDDFIINRTDLGSTLVPFCSDYETSILSENGKYFDFIKKYMEDFKPDYIFIEQAWLWPAIKKYISINNQKEYTIIYSSHNVEYITKSNLLADHNIEGECVDKVIHGIYELEKDLCSNSSYVIACTKTDADILSREFGCNNIIIANNGVKKRDNSDTISIDFIKYKKYIFFVGSAYPPNAKGFWNMLGSSLAFLPPDCNILVAGGVSDILEHYMPQEYKLFSHVSLDRIKRISFVSESVLNTLISNASAIILPIVVGGGSNLKTAEAIAACKPVIATTVACRGFDFVDKLSNFFIADNNEEFIKYILYSLNVENLDIINQDEKKLRESVYWDETLKSITKIIL